MVEALHGWFLVGVRCTAALALLAGCLDRSGGQSGTEDNDSTICRDSELLHPASQDVPPGFQQPLGKIATTFAVKDLPWVWLATGERTTLSIELLTGCATARAHDRRSWCGPSLDTEVRVWSADGVLDTRVRALLEPEYHLLVPIAELPPAVLGPAVWPPDVQHARNWLDDEFLNEHGDPLTLYVAYMPDISAFDVEAVLAHSYLHPEVVGASTQGDFSGVSGPPFPFTPDPALAGACDGAQQYQSQAGNYAYTPRASAAEALSSLVGTWARCLDSLPSSHAGLQVLPDGSWRDFTVEGGELVARSGFEHEGFVQVLDAGSPDYPGRYGFGFSPFGRRADSPLFDGSDSFTASWDPALVFGSDVAEWPPAIYRRATLPVRAAAPEYAEGERAGADACFHAEQGIVPTREESQSFLSGDFVLCSGTLHSGAARLHFDGAQVELQRADGSRIASPSFAQNPMNAGLSLVLSDLQPGRAWWDVTVSRRPLKLRIDDDGGSAVFSALP